MTLAQQFLDRFRGLDRAHGEYTTSGERSAKGKEQGKGNTIRTGPDEPLWQAHLDGRQRLGVVPVTDQAQCFFGAIDVDEYQGLDHAKLEQRINDLGLPLIVCRSKSGGAHLYLFMAEATDAALVRDKLAHWAVLLGHPGVEVFPKQSRLANGDDVGNWINMPYFDADLTMAYAIEAGDAVTAQRFLLMAKEKEIGASALQALEIQGPSLPTGAPPCLQALATNGVPEGSRNNAMFAFSVLARLQEQENPDTEAWRHLAEHYNAEFMDPPLLPREVQSIIKSVAGKNYFYPCDNEPLVSFCNKGACRKCVYGVGGGDGPNNPGFIVDGVTKILTDPPTWIFRVSGINIELDTDDFLQQSRFRRRIVEKLNILPKTMKAPAWDKYINALLQNAEQEEAPEDASAFGMFLAHLYDFCNRKAKSTDRESLKGQGAYLDEERDRFCFRGTHLQTYLEQQKFREYHGNQIWRAIRKVEGVEHDEVNIKGSFITFWSIPAKNQQDEDFNVPHMPKEEF